MAKAQSGIAGYAIGALTGLVFSGLALGVVSVILPGPDASAPKDAMVTSVSGASGGNTGGVSDEVTASASDPVEPSIAPASDPVTTAQAPLQEEVAAETVAETAAEIAAETEVAVAPIDPAPEPEAPSDTPEPSETEAPATPEPESADAPVAPAPEAETAEPEVAEAAPEDAAPEPEGAEAEQSEPETAEPAPVNLAPTSSPALKAHAERYTGDKSAPLLAIVLDQVGAGATATDEIFLLPAPIAVVIDPSAADRGELAIEARDAGFEAMFGLDASAAAGGPEALTALVTSGQPVIGVATMGEGLNDTLFLAALSEALAGQGMALLDLTNEGGGAGFRLARNAGLPAAPTGRRFDTTLTSAAVYQALERAAFDARRTGAFVVVAKPEPAVLQGLRRWMNIKANKSVNVAPLSTVIGKLSE